jgi:hypothetical protein
LQGNHAHQIKEITGMTIHVTFDPTDEADVEYVTSLLAGAEPEEAAPAAKPKGKAKAAPVEEPEEEEAAEGPTMQDAIDKATELVGEGRAAEVKGALANFGVKRVGELDESQVAEFLEALEGDSVV